MSKKTAAALLSILLFLSLALPLQAKVILRLGTLVPQGSAWDKILRRMGSEWKEASGGDVTLLPGVYILDGRGLQVGGNANFTAEGVLLYIPPGDAYVDLAGTGSVRLSSMDSGTWEGITIFQSRSNTNESRIIGTSEMDVDGLLYFPVAHTELGGTGGQLGNQIIAWTIHVFGTGISVNWDGGFPGSGDIVYLVY